MNKQSLEKAILAGGCFWCLEAAYRRLDGVTAVKSGYIGGTTDNPDYESICTGTTGHAEAVEITYDPATISFAELLSFFWQVHDPTTLNRQGNDVGTQYRSAIFTFNDEQAILAEQSRDAAQAEFTDPIVTEITPATRFYPAEAYHDDYFERNRNAGYCRFIIEPKLHKLGFKS